jgi:sterol desaturase/sphingolipid hydroxylase (fatty acid hydroxylase superfamily)
MVVFPPVVLNMLTLLITLPLAYVASLIGGKNVALLFIATVMAYYLLMQILHVFAHTAKDHWIHRLPGIDFLRIHHSIHHNHDYMTRCNFNFLIPLSDWVLGTEKIHLESRLTGVN